MFTSWLKWYGLSKILKLSNLLWILYKHRFHCLFKDADAYLDYINIYFSALKLKIIYHSSVNSSSPDGRDECNVLLFGNFVGCAITQLLWINYNCLIVSWKIYSDNKIYVAILLNVKNHEDSKVRREYQKKCHILSYLIFSSSYMHNSGTWIPYRCVNMMER